jgi:hypothetical protein
MTTATSSLVAFNPMQNTARLAGPLSEHHMSLGKSEVFGSTERRMEDRLTELEVENSRLQRLVAELVLQNQLLRDAHLPSHTFDQNRNRPNSE